MRTPRKLRICVATSVAIICFAFNGISQTRPAATPVPYAPNAAPTATPTPQAVTTPYVVASSQTLSSLRSTIQSKLLNSELRRGQVGIKAVSLNSGQVIFEQNSEK